MSQIWMIIIHECSKKLLKMKNSKSFFLTPSSSTIKEHNFPYYGYKKVVISIFYTESQSIVLVNSENKKDSNGFCFIESYEF